MTRNIITLSDGTKISSGKAKEDAIINVGITEDVNKSKDITPGSAYPIMVEVTLWSSDTGSLYDKIGSYFYLSKEESNDVLYEYPGIFVIDSIDRPNKNTLKIVAYNSLKNLDKDLTDWLKSLDGWPYTLSNFAGMVINECALGYEQVEIPNGDFPVYKIEKNKVTGRQLIKWIGEICCRYLTTTKEVLGFLPVVEWKWYTPSNVVLNRTGPDFYYSGGQAYSLFDVPEIESVHVLWKDKDSEYLIPSIGDYLDHNYYTIVDNPIISALPKDDEFGILEDQTMLYPYLNTIKQEMSGLSYTPCKISFPTRTDIRPGQIFEFIDFDGKKHKSICMKKITKGQKDTVECTGSQMREQYHKP